MFVCGGGGGWLAYLSRLEQLLISVNEDGSGGERENTDRS